MRQRSNLTSKSGKAAVPDRDELLDIALRMLARRALTRSELRQRLKRRKGRSADIEGVISHCVESGYIEESAIAEDHIRRGREERLTGRFLLRFELRQRGIPEGTAERLLDRDYPESGEAEVAYHFARRKLRQLEGVEAEKLYNRIGGALNRRGFGSGAIREALNKLDLGGIE